VPAAGAKVCPPSTTHEGNTEQYRFFAAATTSQRYLRYNRVENNGRETERRSLVGNRSSRRGRRRDAVRSWKQELAVFRGRRHSDRDTCRHSHQSVVARRRPSRQWLASAKKKQIELENDSMRQREGRRQVPAVR